ncbi:ribosomal RNA large subunit methyltransferase F-like protein [Gorgonomyces haynaldii]|nr:ribosomal RNA large subunit methyltransferase F-like protein [Gorgonomyces haynaldii]
MHPRNSTTLDFRKLSQHRAFARHVKWTSRGPKANLKDPQVLRDLSIAYLWTEFHIRLEIPLDSLIPAVTNRLDYILHLEDMVPKKARGIDLGTGCSCIYPLLGLSRNPDWWFLALEIEQRSVEFAQDNVTRNKLEGSIVVKRNTFDTLLPPELVDGEFDFVMCNPPFYRDKQDMKSKKRAKQHAGAYSGTDNELFVKGGELDFLNKLILESIGLYESIRHFTILLGVKGHVETGMEILKNLALQNNLKCVHESITIDVGSTCRWMLHWQWMKQ